MYQKRSDVVGVGKHVCAQLWAFVIVMARKLSFTGPHAN